MAPAFSWRNLLWANPEFTRHRRAELRPVRAITVAVVVAVLCALIGMACWSFEQGLVENTRRLAKHRRPASGRRNCRSWNGTSRARRGCSSTAG